MSKQNYYILISYRGRQKYFRVSAHEETINGTDIRCEYIDYNPSRSWPGVWIKKGLEKSPKVFAKGSPEYKYFSSLEAKYRELSKGLSGTSNYLKAYKDAVKQTPNPLNIKL